MTISGTNFTSDTRIMGFGADLRNFTFVNATTITGDTACPGNCPSAKSQIFAFVPGRGTEPGIENANGPYFEFTSTVSALGLDSISPTSGPVAGGTRVTVRGSNFRTGFTAAGAPPIMVTIEGELASDISVVNSTTITATTPRQRADRPYFSPGEVAVWDSQGLARLSAAFTYTGGVARPTFQSVSPSSGPSSGGTRITIKGTNFTRTMAVLLNARECANVTFVDANTLIVTTPPRNEAGPGLEGAILIYEPGVENSVLASGVFTYDNVTARPVIQSVSPDNGPAAGGTQITITGSDFRAGMMVQVNLRDCTNVTVVSATKITATTPPKNTVPADLEGSVRVDDPRGYFDQKLRAFTYR